MGSFLLATNQADSKPGHFVCMIAILSLLTSSGNTIAFRCLTGDIYMQHLEDGRLAYDHVNLLQQFHDQLFRRAAFRNSKRNISINTSLIRQMSV
jgi:hypothetical protein